MEYRAFRINSRHDWIRGYIQGGPKKLRQIFLAITLVNMDRF